MAGVLVSVPFGGADSLVAVSTSTITVVQVAAAANHPITLLGFEIFGDSTDLDATPIPGELLRQTTAGTMSAVTEALLNDNYGTTIQSVGLHTATAEPTAGAVLKPFQFAPSAGYVYTFPPGKEIGIAGGNRVGLRLLTPAAAVNVNGLLWVEE